MTLLDALKTDTTIKEDGDSLGGYSVLESDLYDFKIEVAFITVAPSKAIALNVHMVTKDKQQLRQQFWMVSNEKKGNKNYYINKKTKEKHYLPGFNQANALCLLTIAKEISKADVEKKVINLYNPELKKEVPTEVDVLTELTGKDITAGVIKQIKDKNIKDAKTGEYVPSGETRTENEVDKFFRLRDGLTTVEIRAKSKEPIFKAKWVEKWKGQVKDARTKNPGVVSGAPTASGTQAPTTSLFE